MKIWLVTLVAATCSGYVALVEESSDLAQRCLECHGWLKEWKSAQDAMLSGEIGMRAVVVSAHKLAGIGNRVRALTAALFLGRVTPALVVYEGDEALETMLLPRIVKWRESEWSQSARERFRKLTRRRFARQRDNRKMPPLPKVGEALELVAWNDDPSDRWRRLVGASPRGPTEQSCVVVALFQASETLTRAIPAVRRPYAGLHLRTNAEFADKEYVEKRMAARRLRKPKATFAETCDACWVDVGLRFASCVEDSLSILVASDDADLVQKLVEKLSSDGRDAFSLPRHNRGHSGIARSQNFTMTGPFVDLFLLARSRLLVGTAGSSYTSMAVAFGGFSPIVRDGRRQGKEENTLPAPRDALIFKTPFVKGPSPSDPTALDLPRQTTARDCGGGFRRP